MLGFFTGLAVLILLLVVLYLIGIIPYNKYVRDMSLPKRIDYYNDASKIVVAGFVTVVVLAILTLIGYLIYLLGDVILKLFN